MADTEATDAKIDALNDSLAEVKKDVRELRGDLSDLRTEVRADINSLNKKVDDNYKSLLDLIGRNYSEMHAGFASLRESIAGVQASVAGLQATVNTAVRAVGLIGMLAVVFFTAGKALHWF